MTSENQDVQLVEDIRHRLAAVNGDIAAALERVGEPDRSVTIIGVTKTVSPKIVRAAFTAGVVNCGENRVQEGSRKLEALADLSIQWHMIGHLQRNKVRSMIGDYSLLHSLDRLSLAKEVHRRAQRAGVQQQCLVQVNVAREPNKSGIDPDELVSLLRALSEMDGLKIRGLMTMAPLVEDPEEVRPVFRRLRELAVEVQELGLDGVEMEHLSMGMTGDFLVAVEEGATMVRIGRALFGPRPA